MSKVKSVLELMDKYGSMTIGDLLVTLDAVIKERDQIKRFYKDLVEDFMPETECIEGCDTFAHAENCPVVNAQASVHKLRIEHATMKDVLARNRWVECQGDMFCIGCDRMECQPDCMMRQIVGL
jgi:hypothetical protein